MNIQQKQSHKNAITPYYGVDGPIGPTGPQGVAGDDSSLTRTTGYVDQSITLDKTSNVSLLLWTLPVNPINGKPNVKFITTIKWKSGYDYKTTGFGVYYGQLEIWDSLGNLRAASKPWDMYGTGIYVSTNPQGAINGSRQTIQMEARTNDFGIGFTYQIFLRIYTAGSANRECYVPFTSSVSVSLC